MRVALYLGAHPDDVEMGCAGTIVKKAEVEESVVIVFSDCSLFSGLNFTGKEITGEFQNSMNVLGVSRYDVLNFVNSRFPMWSHEIRAHIERLRREIRPDVVYLPSLKDPHQDHKILAVEGLRAFRRGNEEIRGYEVSMSPVGFKPTVFVDIEDVVDIKIEALLCYKTQYERLNFSERRFRTLSAFRGAQMGTEYAEAFELFRRCE